MIYSSKIWKSLEEPKNVETFELIAFNKFFGSEWKNLSICLLKKNIYKKYDIKEFNLTFFKAKKEI